MFLFLEMLNFKILPGCVEGDLMIFGLSFLVKGLFFILVFQQFDAYLIPQKIPLLKLQQLFVLPFRDLKE